MKASKPLPEKGVSVQETLLEKLSHVLRLRHYSARTEQAYCSWVRRYVLFHNRKDPREMGKVEIEAFLAYLENTRKVSLVTKNQALQALLFLYREVLHMPVVVALHAEREQKPVRPALVILTRDEARRVISCLSATYRLMAKLLYGSGLRLTECTTLRVKDIDFDRERIVVRGGTELRDRVTILPAAVKQPLAEHLERMKIQHEQDLAQGYGAVPIPGDLPEKSPRQSAAWGWQYVFQAASLSTDPETGAVMRHHIHKNSLQKAVKQAVKLSGIDKPAGCQTFRHSFAAHLIEAGNDIRIVQDLLGHRNVNSTMVYRQPAQRTNQQVISPMDER